MSESEAPLTPGERLMLASLYASLTASLNRSSSGQLVSESECCTDLNRCGPETLSRKRIPVIRLVNGFRTEEAC